MDLDRFARLTDRQIFELYLHPRDKHGAIEVPRRSASFGVEIKPTKTEKPSLETDLRDLDILAMAVKLPAKNVAEMREKLRAKWAAKEKG